MTHNTCKSVSPTVLLYRLCTACVCFMSNFFCVIFTVFWKSIWFWFRRIVSVLFFRSGHFITDSQSVCPSWPRAPNCDSENFGIAFRGASTLTGGRGYHVQGSEPFSVSCVCSYSCVFLSNFDTIDIISSTATNIIVYKGICICQTCQSGHCAAHYAYFIY
jgi:hypothetical protein